MAVTILTGDCLDVLRTIPSASVDCCLTSPPYYGLRAYLPDEHPAKASEIGLEATPQAYVERLVAVFGEVRRVLKDAGSLWLNLGDSYTTGGSTSARSSDPKAVTDLSSGVRRIGTPAGLKPKDLIGIPWLVAFALRADGWYLRQWLPWVKRRPMPESCKDRPTAACEVFFLLSKGPNYFYDYDAVRRRMAPSSAPRIPYGSNSTRGNAGIRRNGRPLGALAPAEPRDKQRGHIRRHAGFNDRWDQMERTEQIADGRAFRQTDLFYDSLVAPHGAIADEAGDLIAIDAAPDSFRGAHFAVYPPLLIEPLVQASCPIGGTVLDPFGGAGTTGLTAHYMGRDAILIELNPAYAELARQRIATDTKVIRKVGIFS